MDYTVVAARACAQSHSTYSRLLHTTSLPERTYFSPGKIPEPSDQSIRWQPYQGLLIRPFGTWDPPSSPINRRTDSHGRRWCCSCIAAAYMQVSAAACLVTFTDYQELLAKVPAFQVKYLGGNTSVQPGYCTLLLLKLPLSTQEGLLSEAEVPF